MAEGADGSLVDTGDEEGSSSTGAEAVSFDTFPGDVSDMVDGGSSAVQFKGDFASSDVMGMLGGVIIAIQGAVG